MNENLTRGRRTRGDAVGHKMASCINGLAQLVADIPDRRAQYSALRDFADYVGRLNVDDQLLVALQELCGIESDGQYTPGENQRELLSRLGGDGRTPTTEETLSELLVAAVEDTMKAVQAQADTQGIIQSKLAGRTEEIANEALDLLAKTNELLDQNLKDIPARDLPNAQRNAATSAGIMLDKSAILRGKPTSIVQHRSSSEELLARLKALGILEDPGTVDGSSEDPPQLESGD